MRCLLAALLVVCGVTLSAHELEQVTLGSGVIWCNGIMASDVWIAPATVQIASVDIWIGTAGGVAGPGLAPVDTQTVVSKTGGFVLGWLALDHYVPFTGLHQIEKAYPAPFTLTVQAGQAILVQHVCNAVSIPSTSQTGVIVNYARVQP